VLAKDKLTCSLTKNSSRPLAFRLQATDWNRVPGVAPEALTDAVLQQRREILAALGKTSPK
jgi:hypothetical protein